MWEGAAAGPWPVAAPEKQGSFYGFAGLYGTGA